MTDLGSPPRPRADTRRAQSSNGSLDSSHDLLQSLQAMRAGDFSVRMRGDYLGIDGKIADAFNEIAAANERMAQQLARVGQVVGREGQTRQRVNFGLASGAWADMESSVNTLIDDLLWPTREVTRAVAAVAQGDLLQTVQLDVEGRPLRGEFLQSANIVNTMIKQLSVFTSEVTRVAREVGTEGKLGGQAQVPEVTGVWKDLTESVNSMANNLTGQVRNIAEVTIAVANGDLSKKITVDVRGEILQLKEAINTMVDQLRSFASEVTRVAREVGTDGKLGGQAIVPGVAGTWKDLTDSVNAMCGNLTAQVRNIANVTTAVARGDLSRKITVDVSGEILELKDTINTMVDQLNSFASEVTRVAREVGTEGKLGGQAQVPGVAGTWKDLTDNVNFMASNLTAQVRNIADVATAIAGGDLSKKITVNVSGEILQLKETLNTMVDQLNAFASEVTRVAREVGTEGKLGGQANVLGVAGTWKDLTDNVNFMASNLTAQVRNIAAVTTAVAGGDLSKKITVDVRGEILELKDTNQHDGGPAQRLRGRGDARGARGRHRRQARRPGRGARRRRHLEGSHRQRQLDGLEPDRAGPQHRRGRDRGGEGRPVEEDHGERVGRNPSAEGNAEYDGGPAQRLRRRGDARGARGRYRRQARRPGRGARRRRHLEGPDGQRQLDGRQSHGAGPQHR
ncbi:HAMP domain-containing protein [Bradyrhizobium elkanii]